MLGQQEQVPAVGCPLLASLLTPVPGPEMIQTQTSKAAAWRLMATAPCYTHLQQCSSLATPNLRCMLYTPAKMQLPDTLSPAWCSPASVRSMLQNMWRTGPCAAAGQSLTVSSLPPCVTLI